MPDKTSQTRRRDTETHRARTAANMADALSFLIRIALQTGMQNVAVSLAGVRKELQAISAQSDKSTANRRVGHDQHERDRLNRPN